MIEAVAHALAGILAAADAPQAAREASDAILLDIEETADLLGVSRMTVTRMVDEGNLPSVIIRRGRVQRIRRIPRAFVERLVAEAATCGQIDLEEYSAAWLAEHRQPRKRTRAADGAALPREAKP